MNQSVFSSYGYTESSLNIKFYFSYFNMEYWKLFPTFWDRLMWDFSKLPVMYKPNIVLLNPTFGKFEKQVFLILF